MLKTRGQCSLFCFPARKVAHLALILLSPGCPRRPSISFHSLWSITKFLMKKKYINEKGRYFFGSFHWVWTLPVPLAAIQTWETEFSVQECSTDGSIPQIKMCLSKQNQPILFHINSQGFFLLQGTFFKYIKTPVITGLTNNTVSQVSHLFPYFSY